jgi:DNA-binding Lrp family transcriptional regulator
MTAILDETDRRLVLATQEGLPLERRPYDVLGDRLGIPGDEVRERLVRLLDGGQIRRIAAVPNHYQLGYAHNGMSVWDVPEDLIDEVGARVGALPFVSHCYHRRPSPPDWPYTLFAMVHGRSRDEVEAQVATIAALLGPVCRGHEVLYSTRILKKSGLRLSA